MARPLPRPAPVTIATLPFSRPTAMPTLPGRVLIVWREPGRAISCPTSNADERQLMLKGLDPLLNADVLYALRAMGHGDELVVCDANFPADSLARQTVIGKLLRIDGVSAPRAVRAILSVFPLDTFVDEPAMRMQVVGEPGRILPVHHETQTELDRAEGKPTPLGGIERMAFYER